MGIHRSARKHGIDDAVFWLELADAGKLVMQAMPLRPAFYELLPQTREDMP